ncbi:hypothetical protein BH09MYX1_BH09MYX1_65460 [soil metagenome]
MRSLLPFSVAVLLGSALTFTYACGGTSVDPTPTDDGGADAGDLDAGVDVEQRDVGYPAPHPKPPVVETSGGPVLTAPKVIPIYFGDDAYKPSLDTYFAAMPGSAWWKTTTEEYGVGDIAIGQSVILSEAAPTKTTSDEIEAWLADKLDGTHSEFPAVDVNNIYLVMYPEQTIISQPNFGTSCESYGGYHFETQTKTGKKIVYSVIPRCKDFAQFKGIDAVTTTISHELVEAATDPLAVSDPAYNFVNTDHVIWNVVPLGEVGDMCTYEPQNYPRLVANFPVTKIWSNKSAAAGHDPCVPLTQGEPYFNSAPVFTEKLIANLYGSKIPTLGVQVPLGQSKTIDVQLFADAPTDDWTIQAVDGSYFTGGAKELEFSWDKQLGNNGDVLHLTIKRVKNGAYAGSEFVFYSQKGVGKAHLWFGFAGN